MESPSPSWNEVIRFCSLFFSSITAVSLAVEVVTLSYSFIVWSISGLPYLHSFMGT